MKSSLIHTAPRPSSSRIPSNSDQFHVAILGQGVVGTEVVNALHAEHPELNDRAGKEIVLSAIHRKHPEKAGSFYRENTQYYQSLDEILRNPDVDLVCELMSGVDEARTAIAAALGAGKHVVSANKAIIAEYWPELLSIAQKENVQLRFEASVAGGVPVLDAITQGSASENIHEIRGIVNGTTNYILTEMESKMVGYQQMLDAAQQMGYAEKDPTADVEGHDACNKLSLLIASAFGTYISPKDIPTTGISSIQLQDILHAKSMGLKVKLIARAEKVDGKIIARVGPELVLEDSPLGQVPANLNGVEVRSDRNTNGNFYRGEGAGALPTSANVLTDIVNIARDEKQGFISPFRKNVVPGQNEFDERPHAFYVRFVIHDSTGVVHQLSGILHKYSINLNSIVQLPYDESRRDSLPFFITVEDTDEETLKRALQEISELPFNVVQPEFIRFGRDDLWRKSSMDS